MTSVWDRQNPRVSYQVPVGVLDPDKQQLLSMISINLSQGGMFVDTPEELPVGKELVCNLPIGEYQAMQVRARVAWQRSLSGSDERRPRGVGIEFIDLSVEDAAQLARIVGEHEELSHSVRLMVDGMQGAINAQAQLTPHGIFFRSPLPFLRLNSQVDFAFEDDKGNESYQGRIVDVKVQRDRESSVPRLQVEVELLTMNTDEHEIPCGIGSDAVYEVMHIDREDTIPNAVDVALDEAIDDAIDCGMGAMDHGDPQFVGRREREFIALDEDDSQNDLPIEAAHQEERLERASESDPILLVMPKRQPEIHGAYDACEDESDEGSRVAGHDRRLWIGVAVMAALVVGVIWASGSSSESSAAADNGEGPLLAQADDKAREIERVRALIEGPESSVEDPEIAENEFSDATEPVAAPASPPEPATGGPKTEPAPPPKKAKSASPAGAAKQQTIGGIHMREDGSSLTMRIPIEGSSERAKSYLLADPAGLAINLPYAQPAKGYHDTLSPESDTVRHIWVRERLGGIHMRVFFAGPAPACDIEYTESQVMLRCKR